MSLTVLDAGDIFAAAAQTLALGLNAAGRLPVEPVTAALQDRYPVFVSDYRRRARAGLLTPGGMWVWRETSPWLAALILRDTPQGAARPRYAETALRTLYQNAPREGITSLALLPMVEPAEWPPVEALLAQYAPLIALPITVYRAYAP